MSLESEFVLATPVLEGSPAGGARDLAPAVTVRLQVLGGRWEVCGVDRYPQILPESLRASSNEWGPDTASFILKRRAGDLNPDLSAYTPCEIEIDGQLVWWGEVWESPRQENPDQIAVNGRGVQYELDDDPLSEWWVHASLEDWHDILEHPDANDDLFDPKIGSQAKGRGILVQAEEDLKRNVRGGVYLDFGPGGGMRKFTITYRAGGSTHMRFRAMGASVVGTDYDLDVSERIDVQGGSGNKVGKGSASLTAGVNATDLVINRTGAADFPPAATHRFYVRIEDEILRVVGQPGAGQWNVERGVRGSEASNHPNGSAITQVAETEVTLTLTEPWRYLHLILQEYGLGVGSPATSAGKEDWIRILSVSVYRRPELEAGGVSVLRSETVITDARDLGTVLSRDDSRIVETDLDLEHFAPAQDQTPRELIEAANRYHGHRLAVDEDRRVVFEPLPTAATLELGGWAAEALEELSTSTGEEIYSDVLVVATDKKGLPLRVRVADLDIVEPVFARGQPIGVDFTEDAGSQAYLWTDVDPNALIPSLDQELPSWVAQLSGEATSPCGPLTPGRGYVFEVAVRTYSTSWSEMVNPTDYSGDLVLRSGEVEKAFRLGEIASDRYTTLRLPFVAPATLAADHLGMEATTGALFVKFARIVEPYSLPARRGRRRTKILEVSAVLSFDQAWELGVAWLSEHISTPFRGTLSARPGIVRNVRGGRAVAPHELLRRPTELIRLSHHIDEHGDLGRDGRIARVEYDHSTLESKVAVEAEATQLGPLLARYGVAFE
jgi:hypothetical protein